MSATDIYRSFKRLLRVHGSALGRSVVPFVSLYMSLSFTISEFDAGPYSLVLCHDPSLVSVRSSSLWRPSLHV